MKRFWLVIVMAVCIISVQQKGVCLVDVLPVSEAKYYLYSSKKCHEVDNIIDSGCAYILSGDMSNIRDFYNKLKNDLYGQSLSFEGDFLAFEKLKNSLAFKEVYKECFDGIYNIYGIGDFGKVITYANQQVNIQICYFDGKISVGCPIILGSY